MANTMLKHTGKKIGKSIVENDCKNLIEEILKNSKKYNCNIICPVDVVVAKDIQGKGKNKSISEVDNDEMILDIGP